MLSTRAPAGFCPGKWPEFVPVFMLKRRGKIYYTRAFVPADLRAIVERVEVSRSLRTLDYRDALDRAAVWQGGLARLWNTLRRRSHTMTREQIEALIESYLQTRLDQAEERVLEPLEDSDIDALGINAGREVWADELIEHINKTEAAIQRNDFRTVEPVAREMLKGAAPELSDTLFRTFCRRLLEAQKDALWSELLALQGQPLARRRFPSVAPSATPQQTLKPSPLLSEVIASYDAGAITSWKPRSAQMAREGLTFFLRVMGDKPIGEVTAAELREYKIALRARPGRRAATLSAATITKHQSYVTGLFKWAHDGELIENNPAPRVLKPEKSGVGDDEQRDAFTDGELKVIFGGDYGDSRAERPERYWIPLLMLYTGARNEEIAQLYVEDIVRVDGVWCIDINANTPDKTLKNKFSKRQTPLHPALIEHGFLAHVESMRAAQQVRLWPNLQQTKRGYNAPVSRWFNRRLELLNIKTPRKDSYSLRHTCSTKLKEQGTAEYLIDQITGHKTEGMSAGRYGKKVAILHLARIVETLSYKEIEG